MEPDPLGRVVPAGPRLLAALAAIALAYHYSLQTLATGWRYDTPLADLILVPPLAACLLLAAARRHRYVGFLRLGRLDFLIATVLLLATIGLVAVGPALWSKYFWAARIDMLTLPLFAAAAFVLLFGARALVPLAFPLLFLLLAWPLPYVALLERTLNAFTDSTSAAVHAIVTRTQLATTIPGSGATRYLVAHGASKTMVGIASACSGANSVVGFAIVGIAALWFVHGRAVRRLIWLLAGAALVWLFNVVRILGVLFATREFGARFAFDLLHPVAGVVALNVAFLIALRLLPLFRLRRRRLDDFEVVDSPLARTAAPAQQATRGRLASRLVVLLLASGVLALADGELGRAAAGYDNSGRPAIASFSQDPAAGAGWSVRRSQRIDWAQQYYGRHSSWVRYRLRPEGAEANSGRFTVWADAILSPDLAALDAYTLAHCYAFHRFRVDVTRRLDLGSDVIGQLFVYRTDNAIWHAVAWQWPVLRGSRVDHERIVLLASTITRPQQARTGRSGWLTDHILEYMNAGARDRDPNRSLSRALRALATQMVAARVATGAHT